MLTAGFAAQAKWPVAEETALVQQRGIVTRTFPGAVGGGYGEASRGNVRHGRCRKRPTVSAASGTANAHAKPRDPRLVSVWSDPSRCDVGCVANVAALIKTTFEFHWVGFYRVFEQELVLGPFQGPVACTRIKIPKGVCGTCVQDKQTIIVADVHKFSGHIACSALSNSEIVLPHLKNGKVDWVLDIDSISFDEFDLTDKENLEQIIQLF